MKKTVIFRFYILIIIFCVASLLIGAGATFGQRRSRRVSRTKSCQAGDITFSCPKGFKPLPIESEPTQALLISKEDSLGLFVLAPERGFDEKELLTSLTEMTLTKLFPKESQQWSWKPLNFSDSISKHEVGGGMAQGYNGRIGVLVKYRHLKVNGRDVFVGYIAEFGQGTDAKESFEKGLGGDSMVGCNASVEVTYSITGEKINPRNLPCTLTLVI